MTSEDRLHPRDPRRALDVVERELATSERGLSSREAARRLVVFGPNRLERRASRTWPRDLAHQFTHPLALLLWGAAALALASGNVVVAIAVLIVILLNAILAFVQEQQAEQSVEALRRYLPQQAVVVRDGNRCTVDAQLLVPGDVIVVSEGDRISADARLISGSLEVDTSSINGESLPAYREPGEREPSGPLLEASNLIFSGTSCTGGEARALAFATGMQTELGRIAALSQRTEREQSPLEREVRKVAWILAAVAIAMGAAFVPLGILAGLSLAGSISFAIGLLLGNVPEGLLPTITLALAIGVRRLASRGALVKRLSAVETLGSTNVICTDKTGTLTRNRMQVTTIWTAARSYELNAEQGLESSLPPPGDRSLADIASAVSACNNAALSVERNTGDPTEIALLEAARRLGQGTDRAAREGHRRRQFHFDPKLKTMSTVDEEAPGVLVVNAKGAPEMLVDRCNALRRGTQTVPLDDAARTEVDREVDKAAAKGLRVLAVARRVLAPGASCPDTRADAEASSS
jgi:magnesium-transporting ATPase (P-type)